MRLSGGSNRAGARHGFVEALLHRLFERQFGEVFRFAAAAGVGEESGVAGAWGLGLLTDNQRGDRGASAGGTDEAAIGLEARAR